MSTTLTDFWSVINAQKWYNSFEIKACLLKYSETDVWKITYLRIELLANERTVESTAPINSNQIKIIDDVFDITSMDRLVQDVMKENRISLYGEDCSLELFRGNFNHRLCTKSNAFRLHNMDYPCLELGIYGNFTSELERTLADLNNILPRVSHYQDVGHAIKRRLGVDHGTVALGLQTQIFIRLEQVQLINGELTVVLNCYPEAELDLVKVVISNVETKEDSRFMEDFIKIGDGSYSQIIFCNFSKLKLTLYHGTKLIEERFHP